MSEQHVDVMIIGAGLSGVGAACHLQRKCPDRTFLILEGRARMGGTWDLFRYPGIRSDSDMYTLGYSFKPWKGAKAIADGPSILSYIKETAREHNIEGRVRYGHRLKHAAWSSDEARWRLDVEVGADEVHQFTCSFLFMATGYYRYDRGYTPDIPGLSDFGGSMVHPQRWPEDLEYGGKRVVVVGSGATAVTLVPNLAREAAHVTMLQRSPTYVLSRPAADPLANKLRDVLPDKAAYVVTRWKNVLLGMFFYNLSRWRPALVKQRLIENIQQALGSDYDVGKHFTPRYKPWDQRVCLVPDGDMFAAIRSGRASVVTDHIERITEAGIELKSGELLEADIIVMATGLELLALGGATLNVDGKDIDVSETFNYRGSMLSDVPNLAAVVGYTNASWTLKCDLTCDYVCRLLNYMSKKGYRKATPRASKDLEASPLMDFTSGYVLRSIDKFPKQGAKTPWRVHQNYVKDLANFRYASLKDGVLELR